MLAPALLLLAAVGFLGLLLTRNRTARFIGAAGAPTCLAVGALLFLVALAFVGLKRPKAWALPLLAVGLAGSGLAQLVSLPPAMTGWAEALTALSLALEGLVALSVLPSAWLLPLFGLHGFLLGGMMVGAEPTPLLAYFGGLMLGQGVLLLLVTSLSQRLLTWLGADGRRLAAGIWIGIGCALAWVALAS